MMQQLASPRGGGEYTVIYTQKMHATANAYVHFTDIQVITHTYALLARKDIVILTIASPIFLFFDIFQPV